LAEAAIDALHHVDVVAGGAPRSVVAPRSRFDGYGLGRADGLAQLAGDAALLADGIAPERMLAAEARRQPPLLETIVHRRLGGEEVAQPQPGGGEEFPQEQLAAGLGQSHDVTRSIACRPAGNPRPGTARAPPDRRCARTGRDRARVFPSPSPSRAGR